MNITMPVAVRTRILTGAAGLLRQPCSARGLALGGAALLGDLGGRRRRSARSRPRPRPRPRSPPAPRVASRSTTSTAGARRASSRSPRRRVVNVPADPLFGNPLFPQQQRQQSLGSGFVVDKAGHIVTNYHVVDGAKQVRVSFSNGASMKATVVGTDPSSDLAVLKIDASSRALTPLAARRLRPDQGRRPGRRDRQPVRARPHGHRGHRQRDPARDHRAQRLHDRPRHPDRRGDQPRQLGRPAPERPRRGDRRQLPDRDRRLRHERQRRRRLRRPVEHGQDRDRAADPPRAASTARSSGSARSRSPATWRASSGCRSRRACSSRASSRAAAPRRPV